ncbi:MAG TPA: hypothetical protein VJH37_05060 [Candidatus Nanoarchaeia archaeon]|nr:hypothetical protein [Candidatus Nanoarchaeia archaeon]
MKPMKCYLMGGLSIFALGYCSGQGCSSETTSTLEQKIEPQQVQLLPQPQPRTLTLQEQLIQLLAERHGRLPSDPDPDSSLPTRQQTSFSQDVGRVLKSITRFGKDVYQEISGESEHCYQEAKDILQQTYGGK